MPMGQKGAIYTMVAAQGMNAASIINGGFASKHVGKLNPRRIEVASPDGPSTEGGKLARLSITLVPVNGQGGVATCGWLDIAQKKAEIKHYRQVYEQFKSRFGVALDLTLEEYGGITKDLEITLKTLQYEVQLDAQPAAVAAPKAGAAAARTNAVPPTVIDDTASGKPWLVALSGVLLALALLGAFLLFK
jgi:hypothetical protein